MAATANFLYLCDCHNRRKTGYVCIWKALERLSEIIVYLLVYYVKNYRIPIVIQKYIVHVHCMYSK